MTRRPFQSRTHVIVTVGTRDRLKQIAKARGVTMSDALESLLADLPPTPAERELTRLAADPAFAAGEEPTTKRGGRKARP